MSKAWAFFSGSTNAHPLPLLGLFPVAETFSMRNITDEVPLKPIQRSSLSRIGTPQVHLVWAREKKKKKKKKKEIEKKKNPSPSKVCLRLGQVPESRTRTRGAGHAPQPLNGRSSNRPGCASLRGLTPAGRPCRYITNPGTEPVATGKPCPKPHERNSATRAPRTRFPPRPPESAERRFRENLPRRIPGPGEALEIGILAKRA